MPSGSFRSSFFLDRRGRSRVIGELKQMYAYEICVEGGGGLHWTGQHGFEVRTGLSATMSELKF